MLSISMEELTMEHISSQVYTSLRQLHARLEM